jgi:hypothetical protein
MSRKFVGIAAISLALLSVAAAPAEPSRQDLQIQIDALKSQIERLGTTAPAQLDPRDVDIVVQQVLADAEHRSAPLADVSGFSAGYSNGKFVLQSEDGNFSLSPGLLLKVRYVTNWREHGKADGSDDTETGFEIRQAKIIAAGNAFTKDLTYRFQTDVDRSTGTAVLQDFWLRYHVAPDWAVRAGQYKDIVHHEETTYDGLILPVDRSLVNALIGGGRTARTDGAEVIYDHSDLHVAGLFHNGINSSNSPYNDHTGGSFFPVNTNFGVSGRAESFLAGRKTHEYDDFTALGNKEDLLVIGGGFDWTQGGDDNVIFHTADVQYEPSACKGLAMYAAFLGAYRTIGPGGAGSIPSGDYYDWGVLAQVAYLLTDKLEIFGRFEYTALAPGALPSGASNDVTEITVGFNYYFHGQNLKLTTDIDWLPNGSPFNFETLGILANKDNEVIFRAQAQLAL